MSDAVPWFGEPPSERPFASRPGVYVVIVDGNGRVAIVRAPIGSFLPGGGAESGEALHETAHREAKEEAGLLIELGEMLGVADERIVTDIVPEGLLVKRGTFFRASIVGATEQTEMDHELLWLTPAEAAIELKYASHVWAIERTFGD